MEAKDRLLELYRIAVANNLANNRKEFASLIGTVDATLSNSIKGAPKYAGTAENLVARAESELARRGVSIHAGGDAAGGDMQKNFDNVSNPDVKDIVNTLVAEMAAQREQLMQEMAAQRHDFMELLKSR